MWKDRREQHEILLEASGPTLPGGYRDWDCRLLSPFQQATLDLPAKIVKAGEPALMVGLIWINPAPSPGGGVSGQVVMGGREYYSCFESIDLSSVTNVVLPGSDQRNTFDGRPPEFTLVYLPFTLPDPGIHPRLFEVHFYVDIVLPGQPFATMATWHLDPEGDGSIPGVTPPVPPHLDHDIPARFLVHRA